MTKNVVVLDYGSGNLRSAVRALERAGADVTLTSDRALAQDADGLVVPGVGAYAACMQGLRAIRGHEVIGRRLAVVPDDTTQLLQPCLVLGAEDQVDRARIGVD